MNVLVVWEEAYSRTMKAEGLESNNPLDPGGHTWRGISRVYWPYWPGWRLIDAGAHRTTDGLRKLDSLQREFYKEHFWFPISGDSLAEISAEVAMKLFDVAVNRHPRTASEYFQRALNICNRNQALYLDLLVDGRIGPKTLTALKSCLRHRHVSTLLNWLRCIQGAHYVQWLESNPAREEFVGLANRAME